MHKIMFVCHGNICRSPMAEFLMKELVKKEGKQDEFIIKSSATSYEEVGNPVHYGARKILNARGIDCSNKRAVKLLASDYDKYDFFICMDKLNMRNIMRIFPNDDKSKCKMLLEFSNDNRDVLDPYWTGDFDSTLADIEKGIKAFYKFLTEKST